LIAGIIVARTQGIEQWLEASDQVRGGEPAWRGSFRDVTGDGMPAYAAYSHSRLSGWTVGLSAPLAAIEGPWRASLWTLTSGAIALLLLAGGLAVAFGRRIARAIGSLSAPAPGLGQGQLPAGSGASRIAEVDAVARELAEAAQARADAIAARVRTEEELAQYAERLRILRDIDRALIAAEEPGAIAEAALVGLRDLLGVPHIIVNLFDLAAGEAEWLAVAGCRRIHRGPRHATHHPPPRWGIWAEAAGTRARHFTYTGRRHAPSRNLQDAQPVAAARARLACLSLHILILEDQASDAELMLHELRRAGFEPHWQRVETEPDYLAHLHEALDDFRRHALPQFAPCGHCIC
jgi:hypothetical protein